MHTVSENVRKKFSDKCIGMVSHVYLSKLQNNFSLFTLFYVFPLCIFYDCLPTNPITCSAPHFFLRLIFFTSTNPNRTYSIFTVGVRCQAGMERTLLLHARQKRYIKKDCLGLFISNYHLILLHIFISRSLLFMIESFFSLRHLAIF